VVAIVDNDPIDVVGIVVVGIVMVGIVVASTDVVVPGSVVVAADTVVTGYVVVDIVDDSDSVVTVVGDVVVIKEVGIAPHAPSTSTNNIKTMNFFPFCIRRSPPLIRNIRFICSYYIRYLIKMCETKKIRR
jgi:hypothetical protein